MWGPGPNAKLHVWPSVSTVWYLQFILTDKSKVFFTIHPRIDQAFKAALEHWSLGFRLFVILIPRSLSSFDSFSFQMLSLTAMLYTLSSLCVMCITLQLSGIIPRLHLSDHAVSLLKTSWTALSLMRVSITVPTVIIIPRQFVKRRKLFGPHQRRFHKVRRWIRVKGWLVNRDNYQSH